MALSCSPQSRPRQTGKPARLPGSEKPPLHASTPCVPTRSREAWLWSVRSGALTSCSSILSVKRVSLKSGKGCGRATHHPCKPRSHRMRRRARRRRPWGCRTARGRGQLPGRRSRRKSRRGRRTCKASQSWARLLVRPRSIAQRRHLRRSRRLPWARERSTRKALLGRRCGRPSRDWGALLGRVARARSGQIDARPAAWRVPEPGRGRRRR